MSSSDASAANSLRVITGPTGAGKSVLALALAKANAGAIISADSRQIYRGFDIGTGKPTAEERATVPHFGVDVAEPDERWSAVQFARAAESWIHDALSSGTTPVVVGGTGFWISSLVCPLADVPDLELDRRKALDDILAQRSDAELHEWCVALDPEIAKHGPAQWRRAIQVALLTGRRLSDWHRGAPKREPLRVRYLLVDPGDRLREQITSRIDAMFSAGWADEVRALGSRVRRDAIAWKSCGYEELRDALETDISPEATREAVVQDTWQYARRQRTWFRRQLKFGPVTRVDPADPDALERATLWWEGGGAEDA